MASALSGTSGTTQVPTTGLDLAYETFGDPDDPVLLMVSGLGAQMITWPEVLCAGFVDRGFHVVRFDNRDVGHSAKLDDGSDPIAALLGRIGGDESVEVPYLLDDMAADAVGLLDALEIDTAHVLGASMGGMISQALAIAHRDRVTSLTSIMSTTGDADVGAPEQHVLGELLTPMPTEREAAVEHLVRQAHVIGSPGLVDEDFVRERSQRVVDRGLHPSGTVRQLLAILASPSRSEALRSLEVPALVVHGDADPLVGPSGGQRTHECLVNSELLMIEGMGHDLPQGHWAMLIESVTTLASRSAVAG